MMKSIGNRPYGRLTDEKFDKNEKKGEKVAKGGWRFN